MIEMTETPNPTDTNTDRIVVGTIDTSWGAFGAALTSAGLACLMLPSDTSDPLQACTAWVRSRILRATIVEDNEALEPVARELRSYLDGSTRDFTFPLDPRGTPFQMSVWEALQEIPYGQVRSYASVAARIGKPRAVRAVGAANGSNPIPILIPCHRVIGSNGTLTGYGGGLGLKERLLRLEGIIL